MKRIRATSSNILPFSEERTAALQSNSKRKPSPANELTSRIVDFMTERGHFSTRLHSGGYHQNGTWVRSSQKLGIGDTFSLVNGLSIFVEVKVGNDTPSDEQLKRQEEVRASGGVYEFVATFEMFEDLYQSLTK